jgi:hypothetical protein
MRAPRYLLDPAERIRELIGDIPIPDTAVLTYSFDQGYERLEYKSAPEHGGMHYAGSYHPDGMCDGEHICSFCGRVHTYG